MRRASPTYIKARKTCWKRDSSERKRKVTGKRPDDQKGLKMKSHKFLTIAISCLITNLTQARAYSTGAPNLACGEMQPGHGFEPQTGEPPAKLKVGKVIPNTWH